MTNTLPVHDVAAEQALIGATLKSPELGGPALITVPADAWWTDRHKLLAAEMTDRIRRELPIDPTLILAAVRNRAGSGADMGPYIKTLIDRAWMPQNAMYFADRIRSCAAARDLAAVCQQTVFELECLLERGDELDLAPLVTNLTTRATDAALAAGSVARDLPRTVLDLLREQETYDWLVPGLLERSDRLMLTGIEGAGKSVLITELLTCLAGGVNPFTRKRLASPLRVAVIDCENPSRLARRRYSWMVPMVAQLVTGLWDEAPQWGEHLFVEFRGDGLNLLNGRDVAWLENFIGDTSPDLLAIGPIYKLHATNINDEQSARELTAVLDGIRTRHGCALLMEAHAGNGEDSRGRRLMRPIGSSLFRRWPEFGLGLVRSEDCPPHEEHPSQVDLMSWRGSREERAWPRKLEHGGPNELPWIVPAEELVRVLVAEKRAMAAGWQAGAA